MAHRSDGEAIFMAVGVVLVLGWGLYAKIIYPIRSHKKLKKAYTFDKEIDHESTLAFIDGEKRKIGFMSGIKTLVEDIEKLESITVRGKDDDCNLAFSLEGREDKIYIGDYSYKADANREANEFKKFLEKLGHSIDIY